MQEIVLINEKKLRRLERLGRVVPLDLRHYVVRDPDGDYLCQIEPTGWATVKYDYRWTKDLSNARVFGYDELFRSELAADLMHGYSGLSMLRSRSSFDGSPPLILMPHRITCRCSCASKPLRISSILHLVFGSA
jgi:hypothetical protein